MEDLGLLLSSAVFRFSPGDLRNATKNTFTIGVFFVKRREKKLDRFFKKRSIFSFDYNSYFVTNNAFL